MAKWTPPPTREQQIAALNAKREAQLDWSYNQLPCPPPAPKLAWTCVCGCKHETKFRGGEPECSCNSRNVWQNVVTDQAAYEAAHQNFLKWLDYCHTNGLSTYIPFGYDKVGAL